MTCPYCNTPYDLASVREEIDRKLERHPTVFPICGHCYAYLVLTREMELRKPTEDERDLIHHGVARVLDEALNSLKDEKAS